MQYIKKSISQLQLQMNLSHKSKKIMHVVNTFRMWNGLPKFCIELEADWLSILVEVRGKSPERMKVLQSLNSYLCQANVALNLLISSNGNYLVI